VWWFGPLTDRRLEIRIKLKEVRIIESSIMEGRCEGDQSGVLQEIPQLNYSMEYVTTHLQEIPQRIR